MDTKRKISYLFIGAVILYLIGFVIFETLQRHQHSLLYSSRYEFLHQSVKAALHSKETAINNITYDYTYWDDMVTFIEKKDTLWARDNIATLLQSYKLNAVWAFNLKKEAVYFINNSSPDQSSLLPLPDEAFKLLDKLKQLSFYISLPEGIFLVSGATIHHTNDINRTKDFHGYLFVAKCLDNSFIKEIDELTGSKVQTYTINQIPEVVSNNIQIQLLYPCIDCNDRTVGGLLFTREFPYLNDFFLFSRISMILFIGIGLLVILLLYILFTRWVSSPLTKINYALISNDVSDIDNLIIKKNEFGHLAQLLENFIVQKKELEQKIIEKNRTEKFLLESEEKFSKAFLFSPAAMMISTLDSHQIISVNESFSKMLGKSPHDLQNQTLETIGVFTEPGLFSSISQILDKNQSVGAYEIFLKTQSGDLRFGILKCDIVYLQGKRCLLSVILDITDRKQVEMAMNIAKEKAEESDKLKYFLLMNMSHELRTPLTGIIGFAEVIKDDSSESLIKTLADKILISSDRLLATLNSIMLLAEIHSGNLSVQLQKCSIGDTLQKTFKRYKELANTKSLMFNVEQEDLFVSVDKVHLQLLIDKILENALKFTKTGGISVVVKKISQQATDWVEIAITDTGIGIPQEKLNDIFQEFRQVSEGVGRSFEGSGLGLSIAKNLTQRMGGEISVDSIIDKGSTFYIRFPLVSMETNLE